MNHTQKPKFSISREKWILNSKTGGRFEFHTRNDAETMIKRFPDQFNFKLCHDGMPCSKLHQKCIICELR